MKKKNKRNKTDGNSTKFYIANKNKINLNEICLTCALYTLIKKVEPKKNFHTQTYEREKNHLGTLSMLQSVNYL